MHPSYAVPVLVACLLGLTATECQTAPRGRSGDCLRLQEGFGPPGSVRVRAETVVEGLEVPWGIAFLPDGDLLVTERPGRLRLVRQGKLVEEPVARVAVASRSEDGLLGIALAPDFATTRVFFLYYTTDKPSGAVNRVEQWLLAPDSTSATALRVILDDIPAARFHSGGRIRIGPDGMLWIGTGDAREPDAAQSRDSLAGKLLRVAPDGGIPPDNPIPGRPVALLGIRNTEGFDWLDRTRIALVDHGPSGELGRRGADEVNVARLGDNLGWPTIWGCEANQGMVTPALTWVQAVPPGGASFYTGDRIPEWKGSLLIGTLGSRHLHRVVLDPADPRRVSIHEAYFQGDPPGGLGRLRDVVMGPDGFLYVTTSNCDGRGTCPVAKDKVVRIVPAPPGRQP